MAAVCRASLKQQEVASPADDALARLGKQIAFYFSDENLGRDLYLRKQMDPLTSYVSIATIAGFPKVKGICDMAAAANVSNTPVLRIPCLNPPFAVVCLLFRLFTSLSLTGWQPLELVKSAIAALPQLQLDESGAFCASLVLPV